MIENLMASKYVIDVLIQLSSITLLVNDKH